ncbi:DUF6213 family protein [Kitasatospora sp. NPDC058444]|uniref:DUF6213 family protein n=1 Tax=Kitasatospora sp. NPDC058444 TaxID=3346504 RepID=UPI0036659B53
MNEYHSPTPDGEQLFQVPVHHDQNGALVVPADAVTALLRCIAAVWDEWAQHGVPGMDPVTTSGLCEVLTALADQLDIQCIAKASQD